MAKGARLARQTLREAIRADRRDLTDARTLHDERPRAHLLADRPASRLGLAAEDRLVQAQTRSRRARARPRRSARLGRAARGPPERPPRREPCSRPHRARTSPVRRDKQREPVERALRANLLRDPDARVRDDHPEEQRVAPVAEDQRHRAERREDRVEDRQHVRAHDARVRAARAPPGRAWARGQTPRRLLLAQTLEAGRPGGRTGHSAYCDPSFSAARDGSPSSSLRRSLAIRSAVVFAVT